MTANVDNSAAHLGAEDTTPQDINVARRVLDIEADALRQLSGAMDASFTEAIRILMAVHGRVVVTGMGKSGHVGRKIAATMASTGTPALYVHPGEASHGDLGMIARGDAVIALSNSGETSELADIVAHARRFSIPLIAVVGKQNSTLGNAADVALILPPATEACPMGLAPTTSTTVMMALGDALSVALLDRKGFSTDQFKLLHPGGRLGSLLIKVEEIMHTDAQVPLVAADTRMSEAILVITANSFGCAGIVGDDGRLIGIITDGDLRRHMSPDLLDRRSGDIMTANPQTIRQGALAAEALGQMNEHSITSLFVVENIRPVGILHVHDCLKAGVL